MTPSPTSDPGAHALLRRKLPIGIQSFAKLREQNCYYVDKTALAMQLIDSGTYYFLSRPRRFGKSLFLDTLREMFEGNQALFTGLAAENGWDWSQKYPVIRINFGERVLKSSSELNQRIGEMLLDNQRQLGVSCTHQSLGGQFSELIAMVRQKTGQRAVVLIDEYDKPILDNIDHSAVAIDMREGLKNFYSVLKGSDEHLKFVFLTGVSKFSKVSLFSGLNNLKDITLDERYSAICGFTDADVDTVFAPELPGLDRELLRQWYDGYNWLGTSVYNPFGLLMLFDTRKFMPHWLETGTPSFLIKRLQQRQQFIPDLSRIVASESLLSTFDVDNIPVESLMFQAGYLTIASHQSRNERLELTLKYPNLEVQSALNNNLLQSLTRSRNTFRFEVETLQPR